MTGSLDAGNPAGDTGGIGASSSVSTAGAGAIAGSTSSGGATFSGSSAVATATGGSSADASATAIGGATGFGGATALGGATAIGGATGFGGATAIGGATGFGGLTASAGAATGGSLWIRDAGEDCDGGACDCVTRIGLENGDCALPIAISAGMDSVCVLLTGGYVECWGGDSSKTSPKLVDGISGATGIVVGSSHACAILGDQTVACWGSLFGDLTSLSDVVGLAAGNTYACALISDGTAKCWGNNNDGKLGDNTQTSRDVPTTVIGLSNASSIAGGFDHNCALINDGTVKCWGNNATGELGNGTYADSLTATPVLGLTGAESIGPSGLAEHNCAVVANGAVYCWGDNSHGQLGDLTTTGSLVPVMVSDLTGAIAVAPGLGATYVLLQDGSVEAWGYNGFRAALGNGTTTDSLTRTKVVGVTHASAIATGQYFACAIADGTVKCWGYNGRGQLGDGTTVNSLVAIPVRW